MAAVGASLLASAVFSMLLMSSEKAELLSLPCRPRAATGGNPNLRRRQPPLRPRLPRQVMSSLGNPRPLCSDCETLCRTNYNAEVETSCSSTCNDNPLEGCRRQVSERCTTDGTCCSSNGTCTCDCNTIAQDRCSGVTDNYTDCQACERGQFEQCYSTCKNDCNNNCKKKKGCHA